MEKQLHLRVCVLSELQKPEQDNMDTLAFLVSVSDPAGHAGRRCCLRQIRRTRGDIMGTEAMPGR
jgi:hypothetical protein